MPEEYLNCVQALIEKGKSKKAAQAICAIQYYKKHGKTPQQAEGASFAESDPSVLLDAFKLAPEDAIAFLKAKGYAISWDWQDLLQEAQSKAFTVAKVTKMDILQDIREMVQKAIDEGLTVRQFQKDLEPRLKAKGWWGKAVDETGKTVQLGSPWRLRNIYRTNLQTAYMAGREKGMEEVRKRRPWWQYIAVLDGSTRPSHAALHGRIFKWNDPFWGTHYPPNGWGCRCRVRSLSEREMKRDGLDADYSTGKLKNKEVLINKKTGELADVTVFRDPETGESMSPDPGWNYNPGRAQWGPDLNKYDDDIRRLYT